VSKKENIGEKLSIFLFLIGYFTLKMFIAFYNSYTLKICIKNNPVGGSGGASF